MKLRKWVKGVLVTLSIITIGWMVSYTLQPEPVEKENYKQIENQQKERGQQIIDSMRNE